MWPFNTKAAPERELSESPRQPEIFYLDNNIGVAVIKWNDYIQAQEAMKHPIVFRALNKIAESVQQVGWKVQDDPEATDAERRGNETFKRDLQAVLNCPNEEMTPAMLRYWMALSFACYGRVPFKVGVSAMNLMRPNGIYPLEARHVRAQLDQRGVATEFEYGAGDRKEVYPSFKRHERNPTSKGFANQIWKPGLRGFQHHDERNSPLQAVGLPSAVIRALLVRAIETANGHPNVRYAVTSDKTLTPAQIETIAKFMNDDHSTDGAMSGKIPIIGNAGSITIHKLDNDLSDIHSKTPSDDMARLIFGAFGIPIALAGIGGADAAKFAGNFDESRSTFWEDTIAPGYVNPIFQGMTRVMCPPGVLIAPDYDKVPAMRYRRIKNMKEVDAVTFMTNTEKRAMFDMEPNAALPETSTPAAAPQPAPTEGTEDD